MYKHVEIIPKIMICIEIISTIMIYICVVTVLYKYKDMWY